MVQGQTALFHAAQAKRLATVDTLLSLGAATMTTASLVLVPAEQAVCIFLLDVLYNTSCQSLHCKLSLP